MHEISVAMSLIDVAAESLEKLGGGVIQAIHLKLGPLAGVSVPALRAAYEMAREGTPLARANWWSRNRPSPFLAPPAPRRCPPFRSRISAARPASCWPKVIQGDEAPTDGPGTGRLKTAG